MSGSELKSLPVFAAGRDRESADTRQLETSGRRVGTLVLRFAGTPASVTLERGESLHLDAPTIEAPFLAVMIEVD